MNLYDGNLTVKPIPGETDEQFCLRRFMGVKYECRKCGLTIAWPGICDQCYEKMVEEMKELEKPKTADDELARIGVPAKYRAYGWKGVVKPDGVQIAPLRTWDGDPPLMSLCGPTGTGKTGVAVCLCRDWILNGKRARWLYMPDWLDTMRQAEGSGESFLEMRRAIDFTGLLVLDEVISNRTTEYGLDRLLQLIDGRDRELRPTLLTSNLMPNALKAHDPRIASRIHGGWVVPWAGADRRERQ